MFPFFSFRNPFFFSGSPFFFFFSTGSYSALRTAIKLFPPFPPPFLNLSFFKFVLLFFLVLMASGNWSERGPVSPFSLPIPTEKAMALLFLGGEIAASFSFFFRVCGWFFFCPGRPSFSAGIFLAEAFPDRTFLFLICWSAWI